MQARAQLPITLVLGMSISVAALRHMLPVKAADVLQAKEFRLVQVWLTSRTPSNHGYLQASGFATSGRVLLMLTIHRLLLVKHVETSYKVVVHALPRTKAQRVTKGHLHVHTCRQRCCWSTGCVSSLAVHTALIVLPLSLQGQRCSQ